jgi:hypothetical protein
MKALAVVIPLVLVAMVSGCTTGIPFLDGIFGGGRTVSYENDVIVITSLSALPNQVKTGQNMNVYADVKNVLKAGTKTPDDEVADVSVTVELYDYCPDLFELDGDPKITETLSPQETMPFQWKLTAREGTKLQTYCDFKVRASYSYSTEALSTLTYISQEEIDRKMRQGESYSRQGTVTLGTGPVKPYLEVQDNQPVITSDSANVQLVVKNMGNGFVVPKEVDGKTKSQVAMSLFELPGDLNVVNSECDIGVGMPPIELIKKESSPKTCKVSTMNDDIIEQTYTMKIVVDYNYEFRKDVKVTLNPK